MLVGLSEIEILFLEDHSKSLLGTGSQFWAAEFRGSGLSACYRHGFQALGTEMG